MKKQIIISFIAVLLVLPLSGLEAETLSERLKGRILLQVESRGEAWYVDPAKRTRHYLGRPADAFKLMRELGLGINNADFDRFSGNMPDRLLGRILIKVEDLGKAYYINPVDKIAGYLGRPADAFKLMRELGLGITTASLDKIEENEASKLRRQKMEQERSGEQSSQEEDGGQAADGGDNGAETEEQAASSTEETATEEESASTTPDTASSTEETIPAYASENCEFLAEYFKGETISGFADVRETEYGINHAWGEEAPEPLSGFKDKFSVRFTGDCYFEAGAYEFTSIFDDGIEATLDNYWLAKSWRNNGQETVRTTTLDIEEGTHRVKVEYYDHFGNATVKLDWEKID